MSINRSDVMLDERSGLFIRRGTGDLSIIKEQQRDYALLDVRPGDVVLDVGAHIGAFANWVYKSCNSVQRIVSVEPSPSNIALLERNTKGLPVQIISAAVVGKLVDLSTTVLLYESKTVWGTCDHSILPIRGRLSISVAAVSFKYLLEEFCPSVCKIDIEGGEYDLIDDLLQQTCLRSFAIEFHNKKRIHRQLVEQAIQAFAEKFVVLRAPRMSPKWRTTVGVYVCK